MLRSITFITLFLLTLFLIGCGASSSELKKNYSSTVGVASTFVLKDQTQRLLDKYQYRILRLEENQSTIYYETEWKERQPFEDEKTQGILKAQSRIIIQARQRTQGKLNKVKFVGETMVMYANASDWARMILTPMNKTYFKNIASDFKTEFRTRGYEY